MAYRAHRPDRPKTHGVVLDLIRAARTISRVELAASSGLTATTITQVVRALMEDGLVIEVGRSESTGGKPRTLLRLDPQARYSMGVQLARDTSVIVVVDLVGRPVARTSFPGVASTPPDVALPALASRVDALLAEAAIERTKVVGLGLVSYGPQDRRAGVLLTPQPTPPWRGYPVAPELAEILQLPVLLDNDATAAAIGELWVGGVDSTRTYGCVYMADGIGGGVVVNGEAYRGSTSNGVEIGHVSLDVDGQQCGCGSRGCLELFAGPYTVIQKAWAVPGLGERLGLNPDQSEWIDRADIMADFARIGTAATAGDPVPRTLIEESARYLGKAAVTLADMFDLGQIVLAGPSFTAAGAIYRSRIQAELDRCAFIRHAHPVRAVLSASGSDAAAIGGAVLVLRSELTLPPRQRSDDRRRPLTPAAG